MLAVSIVLKLAAVVVLLWLLLRQYVQHHIIALAQAVQSMRTAAEAEARYRGVRPDEGIPPQMLGAYAAASQEVTKAGLHEIGDLFELDPQGTAIGRIRWFVDQTGTTCGWFAVTRPRSKIPQRPVMLLFSEADASLFTVTLRGSPPLATATPPFVTRMICEWPDGLDAQLAVHRSRRTGTRFTVVQTLEEATSLLRRLREASQAWRRSHDPAALLEQDVRSVLRDAYATFGPAVTRYLRTRVPPN
jgi:hypothetical protein